MQINQCYTYNIPLDRRPIEDVTFPYPRDFIERQIGALEVFSKPYVAFRFGSPCAPRIVTYDVSQRKFMYKNMSSKNPSWKEDKNMMRCLLDVIEVFFAIAYAKEKI